MLNRVVPSRCYYNCGQHKINISLFLNGCFSIAAVPGSLSPLAMPGAAAAVGRVAMSGIVSANHSVLLVSNLNDEVACFSQILFFALCP